MDAAVQSAVQSGFSLWGFNELLGDPTGIGGTISTAIRTTAAFIFVIAALECFFGFKLFKFWVAVCGFFLFGLLGGGITYALSENAGIAIFAAILLAILGAFLAYKIYIVGVFIMCGLMGLLLGLILTQELALGIIMALVLGILGVIFARPIIIISTSVSGGLLAGSTCALLLGINNASLGLVLGILFAIIGIFVQFTTTKQSTGKQKLSTNPSLEPTNTSSPMIRSDEGTTSVGATYIGTAPIETSNAFESLKEFVNNRIKQDQLASTEMNNGEDDRFNNDSLYENLHKVAYSNRMLKSIMPFIDIILYVVTFFIVINVLPSIILLPIGILCLAKKRHGALAATFSTLTLFMLLKILYVSSSTSSFFELLLMGAFSYYAIIAYVNTEHGHALKQKLSSLISSSKHKLSDPPPVYVDNHTKISCPGQCGNYLTETDKFCSKCGHGK